MFKKKGKPSFEDVLRKLKKQKKVIVLEEPIGCCTHYQGTFEYILAYSMLKCFKFVVCKDCNTAYFIGSKFKFNIFNIFFAPFWNGNMKIIMNDKESNAYTLAIKTDAPDDSKYKYLLIRNDLINELGIAQI